MPLNDYHKEQSKKLLEANSKRQPMSQEQFLKQFKEMNPNFRHQQEVKVDGECKPSLK